MDSRSHLPRPLAAPLLALALLLAACSSSEPPSGPPAEGPIAVPDDTLTLSVAERASFILENTSERTLDWAIEVDNADTNPEEGNWFTITPEAGTLVGGGQQVVTLQTVAGLEPGSYRSVLSVVSDDGVTRFEVVGVVEEVDRPAGAAAIGGHVYTVNALIPVEPDVRLDASTHRLEARSPAPQPEHAPGQLLVSLEPRLAPSALDPLLGSALEELAERHGGTVVRAGEGTALLAFDEDADLERLAALLEAETGIEAAEPNYLYYPHALPDDPYLEELWQLPLIGAPLAWQAQDASPVTVAVIDTAIDIDHPDLQGAFASGGYDFCATAGCLQHDPDPGLEDGVVYSHGTHVTGLLAAVGGNGRGVAGVLQGGARVVPIKVFHDGYTDAATLAEAIRWAAGLDVSGVPDNPHPARVISLSLGGVGTSEAVLDAVEDAQAAGALIVASAGNDGDGAVDFPARAPGVLAVGSVNSRLRRSCFSDYGPALDIVAPGGEGDPLGGPLPDCQSERDEALLSTWPFADYGFEAGTSMAAPQVAAAAALLWSSLPGANAQTISERLLDSAYFDESYMTEERYGAGVLRIDAALGFPGPGDLATVEAVGPSTAVDTVVLDPYGGSTPYLLGDLLPGSYLVEADADGPLFDLSGSETVVLDEGEERLGVELLVEP